LNREDAKDAKGLVFLLIGFTINKRNHAFACCEHLRDRSLAEPGPDTANFSPGELGVLSEAGGKKKFEPRRREGRKDFQTGSTRWTGLIACRKRKQFALQCLKKRLKHKKI
jgi:hypothetical protein